MALPLYPLPWPTARCVASQPSPSTRRCVQHEIWRSNPHGPFININEYPVNSTPHIHLLLLLNEWMNQSITEWMHDWMNQPINQSINQSTNELSQRKNEWTSKGMSEWNATKPSKMTCHICEPQNLHFFLFAYFLHPATLLRELASCWCCLYGWVDWQNNCHQLSSDKTG